MPEAITSVFSQSITQICVVHQIRNSMRFVVWKNRPQFVADLKKIYAAPNKNLAAAVRLLPTKKANKKKKILP